MKMPNGIKVCFLWTPSFLCDEFIIDQTTMEITSTEKGKNKIARNGYLYVFKKMLANDGRCFECELRRKGNQCKPMIRHQQRIYRRSKSSYACSIANTG